MKLQTGTKMYLKMCNDMIFDYNLQVDKEDKIFMSMDDYLIIAYPEDELKADVIQLNEITLKHAKDVFFKLAEAIDKWLK